MNIFVRMYNLYFDTVACHSFEFKKDPTKTTQETDCVAWWVFCHLKRLLYERKHSCSKLLQLWNCWILCAGILALQTIADPLHYIAHLENGSLNSHRPWKKSPAKRPQLRKHEPLDWHKTWVISTSFVIAGSNHALVLPRWGLRVLELSSSNSKEVSKLKLVCGSCRRSLFRCMGKVCCSDRLPFKARRCKRAATLALPSINGCSSRKVTRKGSGSSLFWAKFTWRGRPRRDHVSTILILKHVMYVMRGTRMLHA